MINDMGNVKKERIGIINAMRVLFGKDDEKEELSKEEKEEIAKLNSQTKNIEKLEEDLLKNEPRINKKVFDSNYKVKKDAKKIEKNNKKITENEKEENIR